MIHVFAQNYIYRALVHTDLHYVHKPKPNRNSSGKHGLESFEQTTKRFCSYVILKSS